MSQVWNLAVRLEHIINRTRLDVLRIEDETGQTPDVFPDSHNEHTLTMLWNPDVVGTENHWLFKNPITLITDAVVDHFPSPAVVV